MEESKKRLPLWMIFLAVLLIVCAPLVGFIETVGRQGTIIGRCAQLRNGMSKEEVITILGHERPSSWVGEHGGTYQERTLSHWEEVAARYIKLPRHIQGVDPGSGQLLDWAEWHEGPATVYVDFVAKDWDGKFPRFRHEIAHWSVLSTDPRVENASMSWRIRLWAEEIWMAIHGPHR
jgi:hypothetical protein